VLAPQLLMMTDGDGLTIERREHTLVATVERGEGNRFTPAMIAELGDALERATRDPELRFLRLRARGRAFCLGREAPGDGDRPSPDAVRAVAASIVKLNELCQTGPLVVVAEVQGDAAGFGAGLVGNADVAVAAASAQLAFPEIRAGYAPAVVLSWLPRAVPRKRAFDMVATGRWVDAERAAWDGLLTEVVSEDRLEARVDERIAELAALPAAALRDVKAFFASTRGMDPAAAAAAAVDALVVGVLRASEATGGRG
jgi:methylglutaconyl-CoA hydratase